MKKKFFNIFLFVIFIFFSIVVLSKFEFSFENSFQDWYIRTFAQNSQMDNIKLIVIDEKSTERVRYPWPRYMYADIFSYLKEYANAKLIVFDAVIASYDEYHPASDKYFFSNINKFDRLVSGYSILRKKDENPEDVIKERDNIFSSKNRLNINDYRTFNIETDGSFSNIPIEYLKSIHNLGFINIFIDKDNVLRSVCLFGSYKNKLYPFLALQAYALASNVNEFTVTDKYICAGAECKNFTIPITSKRDNLINSFALINWYKTIFTDNYAEYSHSYYPAIDIFDSYNDIKSGAKPKIDPKEFEGAYVFIGGCASNEAIKDRKVTPVSPIQAGVDIQATIFENLMTGKFLQKIPINQNLAFIFLIAAISAIAIRIHSIKNAFLITIILLVFYYFISFIMIYNRMLMLVITPVIVEMLVFCMGYSYKFFIEDKMRKKLQKAMGQYLSNDIMKKVVKDMDEIDVGGKRADVSVMFVDIRGFTSISEKLPPEEIIEILNEYIATVEPIVRKYNGVVNKFIGDAIMAIFGEPIANKDHAKNCVLCADEILKELKQFQTKLIEEGKPKIEVGIGINSGEVFVGNIGSSERLEYTVIGDVVNTASRIESFNKIYKTKFLISEGTYLRVNDIVEVIEIKDVDVRGKSKTINLYEVLRIIK